MSKRILITGATGFVGSHILESLMQDDSVTVIVACRDKNKLLSGFRGEVRLGDLRDPDYLEAVVKDVDVVCHAAAWTALWNHKKLSQKNYLEPTLTLIDAAKSAGVKQFIFPSTTSANPKQSADALSPGVPKKLWPHLCNIVKIENHLKTSADAAFSTVILRLGIFTGRRYGVGIVPILLPRLKTHLVPWVKGGKTNIPLIDGRDIGNAFALTAKAENLQAHDAFNIVGTEQPTVREFILFVHDTFKYPKPHFGVPFFMAYPFGWLMEKVDFMVPWEPLVTRSIIHLLEATHATNEDAHKRLGYTPRIDWKDSVREQVEEMHHYQEKSMSMAVGNKEWS